MSSEEYNKIDELQKSLYSRTTSQGLSKKPRLNPLSVNVPTDWEHDATHMQNDANDAGEHYTQPTGSGFFHGLLIASLIFFIVAVGIASFIIFKGSNVVSADNVDITIAGPVSVAGGDTVSLDVTVKNDNNIELQLVDLSAEFPAGTASPTDTTQSLKTFRQSLPNIAPKGTGSKNIQAVLYGEENAQKDITLKVEYRVAGSNAVFTKEKTYTVFITSSPLNVSINSYKEVNSKQDFDITATIKSNTGTPLKNLLLKAEYPSGYTFLSSNPDPATGRDTWSIGDLIPGQGRSIIIHGHLEGQDQEDRVFKFYVGTQSQKKNNNIGTQFFSVAQSVQIKKPFIGLALTVNSAAGTDDASSDSNQQIQAGIDWVNNLPSNILNTKIKVTLSGSAFDKARVIPGSGYYRSGDSTILWDKTADSQLGTVAAGDTGHLVFTLNPQVVSNSVNPNIVITVSAMATRVNESNVSEQVVSSVSRTIRIRGALDITGQSLRTVGPFTNYGPIPPKVDVPSSYTIVWTVSNTSSSIGNGRVTAILPPYVKWLGAWSPTTENVSYDDNSRQITWNVGTLRPYTGASGVTRKELAMKLEVTPSINQRGSFPPIIGQAVFTGTDLYTNTSLTATKSEITTRTSTDPGYKNGDEAVTN